MNAEQAAQVLVKQMFDASIPESESHCAALNLSYFWFVLEGELSHE